MKLTVKKRWAELSFDELVRYHSIERSGGVGGETVNSKSVNEDLAELMVRMQEFECVSGLSVMGVGVEPLDSATESRKTVAVGERIEWLERELELGGSCVWMREGRTWRENRQEQAAKVKIWRENRQEQEEREEGLDGEEGGVRVLWMKREEFVRVVRSATEWMEKKEGLLKLPEKYVVVNGETFALPTLVGNDERVVRYGQYGDMQMYMVGIMKLMESVGKTDGRKEEKKEGESVGKTDGRKEGEPSSVDWEKMRMYRNGFLATLLLPTVVEKVRVDDVREKDVSRWMEKRVVRKYDRGERERVAEVMDGAPGWLFSMLWHLVQSCLAYYQGRFPDLVSNSVGKTSRSKNTDMYVAKLGTDNALMKYAGYPSVEAVNDEPVGVILERLDAMNKESKEWERVRKK